MELLYGSLFHHNTIASWLYPGWLVIRYWSWFTGIWCKFCSELWYHFIFEFLTETFHAINHSWLVSWKECIWPWILHDDFLWLGKIMGSFTGLFSNNVCHGWVCHASVMIRRRDNISLLWWQPETNSPSFT